MTELNWTYRAGTKIPYLTNTTIPVTADDVRPNGYAYVAKTGNDILGNGSRKMPYKTLQKAADVAGNNARLIVGPGFWNEGVSTIIVSIIAEEGAVFDGTGTGQSGVIPVTGTATQIINAKLQNWNRAVSDMRTPIYGCHLKNVNNYGLSSGGAVINNCVWENISSIAGSTAFTPNYCTFHNGAIAVTTNIQPMSAYGCIFSNIQIACHTTISRTPEYCSFYNCTFKLPDSANYVSFATIEDLRAAWATAYGPGDYFVGCRFADPKFTDAVNGDFTLKPDSGCRNMGFDGKYIGALGVSPIADNTPLQLTNCTIAPNGEVTIIDTTQSAHILYPITAFAEEREAGVVELRGTGAWRNGWNISARAQVEATSIAAGAALETGAMYQVENGSINYNSQMLAAGSKFTAVAAATTFTTTEGAVVRKIKQAIQKQTVLIKTHRSLGDAATFANLTAMEYEIGVKMTANRAGDVGTGAILRGNGDAAFDPTKALPIFLKYKQIEVIIWPNGIKS